MELTDMLTEYRVLSAPEQARMISKRLCTVETELYDQVLYLTEINASEGFMPEERRAKVEEDCKKEIRLLHRRKEVLTALLDEVAPTEGE